MPLLSRCAFLWGVVARAENYSSSALANMTSKSAASPSQKALRNNIREDEDDEGAQGGAWPSWLFGHSELKSKTKRARGRAGSRKHRAHAPWAILSDVPDSCVPHQLKPRQGRCLFSYQCATGFCSPALKVCLSNEDDHLSAAAVQADPLLKHILWDGCPSLQGCRTCEFFPRSLEDHQRCATDPFDPGHPNLGLFDLALPQCGCDEDFLDLVQAQKWVGCSDRATHAHSTSRHQSLEVQSSTTALVASSPCDEAGKVCMENQHCGHALRRVATLEAPAERISETLKLCHSKKSLLLALEVWITCPLPHGASPSFPLAVSELKSEVEKGGLRGVARGDDRDDSSHICLLASSLKGHFQLMLPEALSVRAARRDRRRQRHQRKLQQQKARVAEAKRQQRIYNDHISKAIAAQEEQLLGARQVPRAPDEPLQESVEGEIEDLRHHEHVVLEKKRAKLRKQDRTMAGEWAVEEYEKAHRNDHRRSQTGRDHGKHRVEVPVDSDEDVTLAWRSSGLRKKDARETDTQGESHATKNKAHHKNHRRSQTEGDHVELRVEIPVDSNEDVRLDRDSVQTEREGPKQHSKGHRRLRTERDHDKQRVETPIDSDEVFDVPPTEALESVRHGHAKRHGHRPRSEQP